MDNNQAEIGELAQLVRELLARVSRLEKVVGLRAHDALSAPNPGEITEENPRLEVVPPPVRAAASASPRRDLETRIGSHWLNRIGIAALLIGISYFLKYAFESNWIGPAGQILIGLVAGLLVVLWSEWFRLRDYQAFSYSLKAVGAGALYLSLWAAFQVYRLVPAGAAFAAMVVITAIIAGLALAQDAEILAALALAGGFATPVLISTGRNHELQLFSYVALLDLATLMIVFSRAWRRLLVLSFAGTVVLYFAWYNRFYSPDQFALTFAFATLFFAMFAMAPMISRTGQQRGFLQSGRVLLFFAAANAGVYFLQAYLMLDNAPARARFAAGLAIVYLVIVRQSRRLSSSLQSELRSTHMALAIAFISLAIAMRLEEHWITLGWFAEAAVLMAAGFWRKSPFVRWLALAVIAAATIKVFAYDIWGLSRGYRIVSFVLLGILLLAVSFAYQRDWLKLSGRRELPETIAGGRSKT